MPLNLYDTLERRVRTLQPMDGSTFRFYCCGPTVYGPAHIGNFRTFVLQDILRRVLELGGVRTKHVRNVTDVDDKTIRASQEAGKSLAEFTAVWRDRFHADCAALNCLPPHVEPGAVAHIPQQIEMIRTLIDRGHAYPSGDGSVYFRVSSFPEYGRLSRVRERELKAGVSVADDDEYDRDTVADFVLWKARKPSDGNCFWPSPWGEGRPGWHLECSAMTREYLGDTFDLHSGGEDLVFPHHENEIAQSECCTGRLYCAHWFHIAHLLVDGRKMSKSLGNLYTLEDLAARGFTGAEVRYVLAGAHYRAPLNFTMDSLDAARQALGRLGRFDRQLAAAAGVQEVSADEVVAAGAGPFSGAWEALNNDLNTAEALGRIFTAMKGIRPDALAPDAAVQVLRSWRFIVQAFGFTFPSGPAEEEIPAEVLELANRRWAARAARDWQAADRLRGELDALGWSMKDGRESYELARK